MREIGGEGVWEMGSTGAWEYGGRGARSEVHLGLLRLLRCSVICSVQGSWFEVQSPKSKVRGL